MHSENFQYSMKVKIILSFVRGLHCGSNCDPCVDEFRVVRVFCVSLTFERFWYSHCFIV